MIDRQPKQPDTPASDASGAQPRSSPATAPTSIGGRFRVDAQLGKGGMATVYRVTDTVSGRELALKQLGVHPDPRRRRQVEALFEHEFRTLAQLSHPRVIEVYDYGVDALGAFYTMELLDGGDIKARSPLPYREACSLLFDVCSSLALLHSRRLLHRDVSVRNVRCTKDGQAKLIDFGAMSPMGANDHVVGTPGFIAPETLAKRNLDARSDLYSVGTTLYYALTGKLAYPARGFDQLLESWAARPPPPSYFAPEIPAALDALVLALLSVDPASRPRTAFEVMERLAASAELDRSEPPSVLQAYLNAPRLCGRDAELAALRARIEACHAARGGTLVFQGDAGVGRTRMLEACVLDAKTAGVAVITASADSAGVGSFALAQALVDQLATTSYERASKAAAVDAEFSGLFAAPGAARPVPRQLTELGLARPALQAALARWLLRIAERQALVIAVDDVDRVDEASVALLVALARGAAAHRLLLICTTQVVAGEQAPPGLGLLLGAAERRTLGALSPSAVEGLLGSIFGDVPNLQLLSERIYASAGGNPRDAMDLLRHLLDHGSIRYERGNWTLPSTLTSLELPNSAEEAFRERCAALTPEARCLIEAQALASHGAFTRDDYAALLDGAALAGIDHAIAELVSQQVVARDGVFYTLKRASAAQSLSALLSDDARSGCHRALARLYDQKGLTMIALKHLLLAGLLEQGFDRLAEVMRSHQSVDNLTATTRLSVPEIAAVFEHARALARTRERPPREIAEMEHWLVMLSTGADERHYFGHADSWLARLERDSGLLLFRGLHDVADAGERLRRALTEVSQQHQATPEAERCYPPIEAIQYLAHYVAASLAVGSRTNDTARLRSLPELLEPFAPLAPLLDAVWQNAVAACEAAVYGRTARARSGWLEVFAKLEHVSGPEPRVILYIRNAVAYAIGLSEAAIGLESATRWADLLDGDLLQAVNAMYLRKVLRLASGDIEGAERFRRQAELLDVQASARPMFTGTLVVELNAHALANDLTGVQQVMDRIGPLAARFPGWVPYRDLAEGHFQLLRGDLAGARAVLERCIAQLQPDVEAAGTVRCWPLAVSVYVEVLTELGEATRARAVGEAALATCAERGIDVAVHSIARSVALAEARLGLVEAAAERMDQVIAEQRALGASGLYIGASYEARARIAIAAKDEATTEAYARLSALACRHGTGSVIVGRHERLRDAAQRAGVSMLQVLTELQSTVDPAAALSSRAAASMLVKREMRGAETASQRAARALRILCEAEGARAGQLYLFGFERELSLVATLGTPELGAGFETWAVEYLAQEQSAVDKPTVIDSEPSASRWETRPRWTGSHGAVAQALPLRCVVHGADRWIGVAALITDELASRASAELVAAVSEYLIGAGDA